MTTAGKMLVLARREVAGEFADRLDPDALTVFDDPYEAMEAMEGCDWSTIIITASFAGLEGLCHAVRRLQRNAKLIVLCGSAVEPEVRALTDGPADSTIDDYFIYPLTNTEWRKVTHMPQSLKSGTMDESTVSSG
ncbi:MAG: hypothetical protein GY794_07255 [bacterium]|nr:hypothetical protein [bacterium]